MKGVSEVLGRGDYAIISELIEPRRRCSISAAATASCWRG